MGFSRLAARACERADKTADINAVSSATFEERQKLSNKVDELSRALEKKSAGELGEVAEINLFEALKAEFESDRIECLNKSQPGADILHPVVHYGLTALRVGGRRRDPWSGRPQS